MSLRLLLFTVLWISAESALTQIKTIPSKECLAVHVFRDEKFNRRLVAETHEKTYIWHSMVDPREPGKPMSGYIDLCAAIATTQKAPSRVFNVGLGGGEFPRWILKRHKNAEVVTAEIDEAIVELSREYFFVKNKRHRIIIGDAIDVLQKQEEKFDMILSDAFGDTGVKHEDVPDAYFASDPLVSAAASALKDDGLLLVNLYSQKRDKLQRAVEAFTAPYRHWVVVLSKNGFNRVIGATNSSQGLDCNMFMEAWDSRDWIDSYVEADCADNAGTAFSFMSFGGERVEVDADAEFQLEKTWHQLAPGAVPAIAQETMARRQAEKAELKKEKKKKKRKARK